MAKQVAVIGDKGNGTTNIGSKCCPHRWTAKIVMASSKVTSGGKGMARVGDRVTTNCPHFSSGRIISASAKLMADGKQVARSGDMIQVGPYTVKISILTGPANVTAN